MRIRRTTVLAMILALSLLPVSEGRAQSATDDQQLHALLDNYATAVDTLDPNLIGSIWSHSPDVSSSTREEPPSASIKSVTISTKILWAYSPGANSSWRNPLFTRMATPHGPK